MNTHWHSDKIMQFAKMVQAGHPISELVQYHAYDGSWVRDTRPIWAEDKTYRVARAFVEGKPVFAGDEMWFDDIDDKVFRLVSIIDVYSDNSVACTDVGGGLMNRRYVFDISSLSWKKPEKTVTMRELLREIIEGVNGTTYSYVIPDATNMRIHINSDGRRIVP